jgi:hypothetical protein
MSLSKGGGGPLKLIGSNIHKKDSTTNKKIVYNYFSKYSNL